MSSTTILGFLVFLVQGDSFVMSFSLPFPFVACVDISFLNLVVFLTGITSLRSCIISVDCRSIGFVTLLSCIISVDSMTLVVMVGQQLGLCIPSLTFSQNTWCCTLGLNFLRLRYPSCFWKIYVFCFIHLLIHCYSQMKHLIAASIALKGVGSLLFIVGSSFGAYLLVSGYQGFLGSPWQ